MVVEFIRFTIEEFLCKTNFHADALASARLLLVKIINGRR